MAEEQIRARNYVAQSRRKTLLDIESLARGHTRKAVRTSPSHAARRCSTLNRAVPAEQPILKVVRVA
jgi:hypothetical protein